LEYDGWIAELFSINIKEFKELAWDGAQLF
jgi:hypothetical protein